MTPALKALKAALERYEACPSPDAAKALSIAATAAGFNHAKAVETWARWQIAVAEAEERFAEIAEADPDQPGLF